MTLQNLLNLFFISHISTETEHKGIKVSLYPDMSEIKDSNFYKNVPNNKCGFSATTEKLTPVDMQRLVIPKLSSPSYVERQNATLELMKEGIDLKILSEALSNSDPNIRRRIVDILDVLEFEKERSTFLSVGDQESLRILLKGKHTLRESRNNNMENFPDGKIPLDIARSVYKSKIHELIDINDLTVNINTFKSDKATNTLPKEEVQQEIKASLLNIVDIICDTPEYIKNKVEILKTLEDIEWKDFNQTAGLRLLHAIEEVVFSRSNNSDSINYTLHNNARALLGLDPIHNLVDSDRVYFKNNIISNDYLEGYKQIYNSYLELLNNAKNGSLLNEKGELLFYYKEFLGVATSCHGPFFSSKDSPIFFAFANDFHLALKEKDFNKIRVLYNKNIDILKVTEFDKEELCCDWDVIKYRSYLPLIVDKILAPEEKKSEISPSLQALFQMCILDHSPSTGRKDLDLEIEQFLKKIDDSLLEGAKDGTKDFSSLLQTLAKRREGAWNLASLISSLNDNTTPSKLKEAYLGYFETEEKSLNENLIRLLHSEPRELDAKLGKFYRSDYIDPITIQQVYEALAIIENNIHFIYSDKVVRDAKLYKMNLVSKLRNSDEDVFSHINEAKDFVLKVESKLMR